MLGVTTGTRTTTRFVQLAANALSISNRQKVESIRQGLHDDCVGRGVVTNHLQFGDFGLG